MRRNGFTMIELVVMVAVLAMILVTVTAVMLNSMKARSRVETGDRLEQNGNLVLSALRDNFLTSNGQGVSCLLTGQSGIGSSVSFINRNDGVQITLNCAGGRIASNSAVLTSSDVTVSDCSTFVTCDTLPSSGGIVSVANFSFVLKSGVTEAGIEGYASRRFETKVVVR